MYIFVALEKRFHFISTQQKIQHAHNIQAQHNTAHKYGHTESTYKRKKTNLIQESYEQQNQVDHYLQSLAMCVDDGSPV